ncbi:MAG: exo-alpha-sialidase, partial [Gammaproteobacteria bacterium]|nr:exo-alpha-sialidase [Gammaproteobacteria bacterium]
DSTRSRRSATAIGMSRAISAEFLPDKHPEFGQCVHKIAHHPTNPGRLFLQNHWGLYRSEDWGDTWVDIANGVPSDFGFAMAMHPGDPDTVYIVPIESDGFRCTPDAKLRVYRTRDGGASWHPLTEGLPQENAYETVLRDALATLAPGQVFFGTRSGKVYASRDDGDSWELVRDGLPPVVCVKACVA